MGATLLLRIAGQLSASGWYRASDPPTEGGFTGIKKS
jgi:hypothetical protein